MVEKKEIEVREDLNQLWGDIRRPVKARGCMILGDISELRKTDRRL